MVTKIDRLARSVGDLQDIVRAIRTKGADLKATDQPIDTSTAAGKCFLDMLGVFAEFERAEGPAPFALASGNDRFRLVPQSTCLSSSFVR
jgi:Resolvase, N terminal domain